MKYINLAFFTIGVTLIICFFVIQDYYKFNTYLNPTFDHQHDLSSQMHVFTIWKIYLKTLIISIVLYTLLSLSNFITILIKEKKEKEIKVKFD